MVSNSKDRNNAMLAEKAYQSWDGRVVLLGILGVTATVVQMTLLIIPFQDAREDIGAVSFIMKGRFSREDQQMGAVRPPTYVTLQQEKLSSGQKPSQPEAGDITGREDPKIPQEITFLTSFSKENSCSALPHHSVSAREQGDLD